MEKRLPLPVGAVLQGRYRIVRQLGHGGFGAVYEAVDDDINLTFALKETFYAADEELRQAFKREARMLASLSHDAFPRISHYFTENDGCFLVMELIRGDDLDKLLFKQKAPFEERQVLEWADQILDALEDLHASGIIHRDIKPSNIKLTPKGRIKLLDFGIAKGRLEGETTVLTTVGSMAAATMQYAPLEQILKASPQHQMMLSIGAADQVEALMRHGTDASSDLYALAVTFYQLLTNRLPVDAATRALALWSGHGDRLVAAHDANPQVSRAVSDVLQRALKIDPRERLSSAGKMREMLKAAARAVFTQPVPPVVTPPLEPPVVIPPDGSPVTDSFEPVPTEDVKKLAEDFNKSNAPQPNSSSFVWLILIAVMFVMAIGISLFGLRQSFMPTGNVNSSAANTNLNTNRGAANANSNNRPPPVNYEYALSRTLTGHGGGIYSIVFSPDGKTIVSGSGDNTIKLWDRASGTLKQTLTGHTAKIFVVAFSPDGATIASGSDDKTVKLWDAASGTLKQTLTGHAQSIFSVAFSPDGKTIASGSQDNTIKLWDVASGGLKQTLTGHAQTVFSVAFSPDGKTIASGSGDKTVKLWDAASGSLRQTLTGHTDTIYSITFSPDGSAIISGSIDKTVKLWDAASGSLKQTLTGHTAAIESVAFSPDGSTIASGSIDKTVILWDAVSGSLKQTLTGHSEMVLSVIFSPDSKTIASGSMDKTIKLCSAK